ncbi:Zn(2)-C6 fungal-type domain-containing protein [Fusarium sp. Ph1]|nr:Zn(2)-C6 fungal-type domain-containing protein [Fusarium sp. Ph1]
MSSQATPRDDNDGVAIATKRPRAKQACRECNARRIRCNAMESNPCSHCKVSGASCQLLPSLRGRYPRRRRPKRPTKDPGSGKAKRQSPSDSRAQPSQVIGKETRAQERAVADDAALVPRSPSPLTEAKDASGVLFFGESNFLTLVPGKGETRGRSDSSLDDPSTTTTRSRMVFSVSDTPESASEYMSPVGMTTSQYLRSEGALTIPSLADCIPALESYFTWFHPCFPVIDRADFSKKLATSSVSYLLLQSMLFIAVTYCDENVVTAMGFSGRTEAKSVLYARARLLFHADWEKDKTTLLQSLFLISFWRGGPSDVRDVRYWLGVVIGVAESNGLHRSPRLTTRDSRTARLRRRIWWSIYVRERQAAASLGLPSRIRDDDCDVEPLSPEDLVSDFEGGEDAMFGSCTPEHVKYAVNMVEISRILGQVVDVYFAPRRVPSRHEVQDIETCLEAWRLNLSKDFDMETKNTRPSVWEHLLMLAYNHVRVLMYRNSFLKPHCDSNQLLVNAASNISRIAEDMLEQGVLRYGQMHLVTSLFAALCIHTISIKREVGVQRRIAEHRAQMCLLGLKEIQKYWRINNNILDLFLNYLDASIARKLRSSRDDGDSDSNTAASKPQAYEAENLVGVHIPDFQHQQGTFEQDEYFNLVFGPWDPGEMATNLDLEWPLTDLEQMEGLDFLSRSL